MNLFLFLCLEICLFFNRHFPTSTYQSIYLLNYLSIYLSAYLSGHLTLSIHPFIHLSMYSIIQLFIYPLFILVHTSTIIYVSLSIKPSIHQISIIHCCLSMEYYLFLCNTTLSTPLFHRVHTDSHFNHPFIHLSTSPFITQEVAQNQLNPTQTVLDIFNAMRFLFQ